MLVSVNSRRHFLVNIFRKPDTCVIADIPNLKKKRLQQQQQLFHVPMRVAHCFGYTFFLLQRRSYKTRPSKKHACQRQGSEMTTVTFVFLTLFIWVLSCETWRNLDLHEHYEETKAFAALCKNVAIHDNDSTKLIQTCYR